MNEVRRWKDHDERLAPLEALEGEMDIHYEEVVTEGREEERPERSNHNPGTE